MTKQGEKILSYCQEVNKGLSNLIVNSKLLITINQQPNNADHILNSIIDYLRIMYKYEQAYVEQEEYEAASELLLAIDNELQFIEQYGTLEFEPGLMEDIKKEIRKEYFKKEKEENE